MTARSLPTTPSSARPGRARTSIPTAIAARWASPSIRRRARCGENENGPNGGDEINIIKPGANYGWPYVSLGRTYQGPWQAERPRHDVFEPPVVYWMPAVAPSGMLFYTGDALPAWKGDIFVGALRTGEIPGTGHLERILINADMEELRRETLLYDLRQRIRDVRQGPDGFIYLATEERDGAILRIVPDG